MSSSKNRSNAVLTIIFMIGIVASAFTLFTFQDDLAHNSTSVNAIHFESLQPTFNRLYIIIGSTLVVGLIALYLALTSGKTKEGNVVYVEKKVKQEEKNQEEDSEEKISEDIDEAGLQFVKETLQTIKVEKELYDKLLSSLCKKVEASQAAIYLSNTEEEKRRVQLVASYAYSIPESQTLTFEFGEGLVGQVAKEGRMLNIDNVPDNYLQIVSGLGSASPSHLLIMPLEKDNTLFGVVEIASFKPFSKYDEVLIQKAFEIAQRQLKIADKGTTENEEKDEEKSDN